MRDPPMKPLWMHGIGQPPVITNFNHLLITNFNHLFPLLVAVLE